MTDAMLSLGQDRRDEAPIDLPMQALLRHLMALGSSGSGKTVLCKVLVEEVVRQGLPALCIDPQGDLCSLALDPTDAEVLAERGVDPALAEAFAARADVVVFTPASGSGIGLSADPVNLVTEGMNPAERTHAISRTAAILARLLGYDPDSDDGTGLTAVLDHCLQQLVEQGRAGAGLAGLTEYLHDLPEAQEKVLSRYLEPRKINTARQRLARLDVGARRMLFHQGAPIDIDMLLGRGVHAVPGKTRVSVIYLNSLHGQDDKDFFVATLVDQLYAWMLRNPSPDPQALFYIDEVAPFVPPVRKPAAKPGLQLLFKQARKYGVCCLMATQNPGDVDYKSMAQFGTWALGRLTTRQDLKKVEPTIKSILPTESDRVMGELPSLGPGQFVLISPDHWPAPRELAVRWLLTPHETLDEGRIEAIADLRWRQRFAHLLRGTPTPSDSGGEFQDAGSKAGSAQHGEGPRAPGEADEKVGVGVTSTLIASPVPPPAHRPGRQRRAAPMPDRAGLSKLPTLAPEPEATEAAPRLGPSAPAPVLVDAPDDVADTLMAAEPPALEPVDPLAERREALAQFERALARCNSMTLGDFADKAGVGQKKARAIMNELIELGMAGMYPQGRKKMYWAHSREGRPDLGLPSTVSTVRALIDEAAARARGQSLLRSRLLGLFGQDESIVRVEPVHRLVYRLDFEEKVPRPLLQRVFGASDDLRQGSVYLHPASLDVLVFSPDKGIRFVDQPGEHASAVEDLDGAAVFEDVGPGTLALVDDDWRTKQSPDEAKARFTERFAATPSRVSPLFVPLWRLVLRVGTGEGFRIVAIDGLAGRPVEWP